LKEGLLGDAANVRASRRKAGPFEALQTHPEFRDLILALPDAPADAAAAPVAPSTPPVARTTRSTRREATLPPGEVHSTAPQTGEMTAAPHITLDAAPADDAVGPRWEWLTWLGLIAIAVASAVAAYYLIPDRLFLR
jgi:hypothetical protein